MGNLISMMGDGSENRPSRTHVGSIRVVVEKAERTAVELDRLKRLYAFTMNLGVGLDNERQMLAHNNPEVAPMLAHLEMSFFAAAEGKLRSHADGLGF